MSHPLQPPGYRHLGGNVFVATAAPARPLTAACPAPRSAQAVIEALTAALTPRADSRGLAQADMRRQLARAGTPAAR